MKNEIEWRAYIAFQVSLGRLAGRYGECETDVEESLLENNGIMVKYSNAVSDL